MRYVIEFENPEEMAAFTRAGAEVVPIERRVLVNDRGQTVVLIGEASSDAEGPFLLLHMCDRDRADDPNAQSVPPGGRLLL